MKKMLFMAFLMPLALMGGIIKDTTGWITGLSTDDPDGSTSYSGTGTDSKWKVNADLGVAAGEYPQSGRKYLHQGKRLRTPYNTDVGLHFAGETLALDGATFTHRTADSYGAVQIDDFWLCSGTINTWQTALPKIAGTMTVYSSESNPVKISLRGQTAKGAYGTLDIESKICGNTTYLPQGEELMLSLEFSPSGSETVAPCTVRFVGDCTEYEGVVKVNENVVFEVGNAATTDFPAEVRLLSDSCLTALPGTTTKFRKVSMSEGNGSADIVFPYDAQKGFGAFELDALSVAEGGKVRIVVKGEVSSEQSRLSKTIMTLPTDPTGCVEFDLSSFTYETGAAAGRLTVEPRADGGYALKLTTYNLVTLVTGDESTTATIADEALAIGKDECWDPQKKPQVGYDYFVPADKTLRMPSESLTKFPGESLTVEGTYAVGYGTYFDVGDLHFTGGSSTKPLFFTKESLEWSITGRVEVAVDDGRELLIENYGARGNERVHTFGCEFYGSGDIQLKGHNSSQFAAGRALFNGDNTGFKGRLYLTMQNTRGGSSPNYQYFPRMDDGCSTELRFDEEKNLGGPLDAFRYDALKIDQMAVLRPTADVTLSAGSNRGILVGSGSDSTNRIARFRVDEGLTMTVTTPITYNGVLYKEGAGTLVLGGKALFADGKETTAPVAGNNGLIVSNGFLKVVSSSALDGVAVKFCAGTGLVLSGDVTVENHAVGLYNVKIDNPLDLSGTSGKLAVSFDSVAAERQVKGLFGICTVSAEAAKTLSTENFKVARPWRGSGAKVVKKTNPDGTVTFSAEVDQRGLLVVFR